jgi:hypothetical protein
VIKLLIPSHTIRCSCKPGWIVDHTLTQSVGLVDGYCRVYTKEECDKDCQDMMETAVVGIEVIGTCADPKKPDYGMCSVNSV